MGFTAYLIREEAGKVEGGFVQWEPEALDPGEVDIQVAYSSVNYKDALAATGAGKIIRRFPCIGGVDLAGVVLHSRDARFAPGDKVLATSYDLGVAHHGGFAERARVPAQWVLKLPEGLSMKDAMALGTAGFTAGLAVVRMEHNGLTPQSGPVLVSGASGGVGSIAVALLAQRGYAVTALTGKENEQDYLYALGAKEVLLRQSLDLTRIKPLMREHWAGAVDNLGGEVLAWLLSRMQRGGTLASIGLASSVLLNTTVMPFILRGVALLGIDSVNCPMPLRSEVWHRLAGADKPKCLAAITQEIPFADLPKIFEQFIESRIRGRVVVAVSGG